jgi:cytochrome c5
MKLFLKATLLFVVVIFLAVVSPAAAPAAPAAATSRAQQSKFPEGPGRAILEKACSTCHDPGAITNYHFATAGEYKDIVESMIGTGAVVTDAEKPVLVDYLFKNFGKKVDPNAVDPGKEILEKACTVCHGLDGLANHVYDSPLPYRSLVESMIAYGAPVTDEQLGPLVDYMFKTYGKK